jgi:hypothetical protein
MRCISCGFPLRGELEKLGARCPHCRQPLYEDPRVSRGGEPVRPDGGSCVVHPGSAAVGACQRCGNFLCGVCRTRWRRHAVCVACLQRMLEAQEASPVEAAAHRRQAILGILFGGLAWLFTLVGFVLIRLAGNGGEANAALGGLGVLALLPAPPLGLLGVGQGAAAIRGRGDHMILATLGLILSGLHTGVVIGLMMLPVIMDRLG